MLPGAGSMDPRHMAMMMRKMGIEMRDIEDVREVVVRTREREYRFARPAVSVMKAQGNETWQVQGKPKVTELADAEGKPATPAPASTAAAPTAPTPAATPAPPAAIPEEDVRMVMEQTGKDRAAARGALESTNGDIAEAIVRLS
ncbi:MAG TPA: nascent polypeptide-associated complex protein [Candidatus Thermoplasmatota archaeon]|nr:nascent polypeptide-associated complex protein [Candidatus Thermoplasmatota archaeon]